MRNFDYCTPTRLLFGKGVIAQLPAVMKPFGKRILLTYGGGSIKKIGLYQQVLELLKDFEIVECPGIQPNPKYDPSSTLGSYFGFGWMPGHSTISKSFSSSRTC